MAEWYEHSFGEDYLLVYKHRDTQGARREVERMVEWLELPQEAKVLDLCCGMGRHSMALVEAGFEVTGVDLSEVLLREARRNDPEHRVTWLQADMRKLPLTGGFDAVVNLFSSFGYFKEDREHIQVLREIKRVLKPEGKFIIDYLNPRYIADNLIPESERMDDGQRIVERRMIQNGYVMKRIWISQAAKSEGNNQEEPREYLERIKLYTAEQFTDMLGEAGLILEQIYGSHAGESYDPILSPRMILLGGCQ
ncbi:class I SAM-dependent methyltransferase [Paenibacillus brevis]|uniref:Methyltransferase domain-containing protein n=1 Tax=Paenibacillus brevis TaxID=2841508 RepID=A0ABS6FV47_9BACL|nr:class I SAM-dependent methyltransferase [Paenibacillus brevis]MBU5674097.1 methyltransferase domain-containing protein [Paenibacillus brevis]